MSSSLYLTSHELKTMIQTSDDTTEIGKHLLNHPLLLPCFQYWQSLHRTAKHLEQQLEKTHEEMYFVFDNMKYYSHNNAFAFFVTRKCSEQYHPYRQCTYAPSLYPSSPIPSSLTMTPTRTNDPPATVKIADVESNHSSIIGSSFYTAYNDELGLKYNPIYVLGNDKCKGCHEEGHSIGGCTKEY